MKNLLIIILLMVLSSCNKGNNHIQAVNIDSTIEFYILDKNGTDLLDANNQNNINLDIVKVFDVINGNEVEVYNPNSNGTRGFVLFKPEGMYDKYRLSLGLNITEKSNKTTTIVKWNERDIDIFKAEFHRGSSFVICTKVWLNNKLVWDTTTEPALDDKAIGRFIKIIK